MEEDNQGPTSTTTTTTTETAAGSAPTELKPRLVLQKLLSGKDEDEDDIDLSVNEGKYQLTEEEQNLVDEGMCVECEDQPASLKCNQCEDDYCDVCFQAQHRKGKRKHHTSSPLEKPLAFTTQQPMETDKKEENTEMPDVATNGESDNEENEEKEKEKEDNDVQEKEKEEEEEEEEAETKARKVFEDDDDSDEELEKGNMIPPVPSSAGSYFSSTFSFLYPVSSMMLGSPYGERKEKDALLPAKEKRSVKEIEAAARIAERAKYIPVRLTLKERKLLRLLEAALSVSEYTDKIDIISYKNKAQRINVQIKDICAILTGLVVASDYRVGKQMVKQPSFKENAEFFQVVFEIGRRHKIMNPEKMRTEYGKLVYLLQDSVSPVIKEMLEFSCVKPLTTVYSFLAERNAAAALEDERIVEATAEIKAEGKQRHVIQKEIKTKERAIEHIAKKYASSEISADDIKLCLYSIGDNNSFLKYNRDPVDTMINFLTTYFKPDEIDEGYSLAIKGGFGGARLTHNHTRQYYYVLQSLTLWREILNDMFKLWYLAETDLLDETTPYRLRDTGQGLNRVQSAPRIGKAMHQILHKVQTKVSNWVGSSVIHLGDNNVPNALMFIDKYTQVSRILNPIVLTVSEVDNMMKNKGLKEYIKNTFGGALATKKMILSDFFRHAFDGSGADNFFDAGSCIDGRLTSAWNWCSKIEKKDYYPIFKLAGFNGFDGDFQK